MLNLEQGLTIGKVEHAVGSIKDAVLGGNKTMTCGAQQVLAGYVVSRILREALLLLSEGEGHALGLSAMREKAQTTSGWADFLGVPLTTYK